MASEISLNLFEKNAKVLNKMGFERSYLGIAENPNDYTKLFPIGVTSILVIEATVDKEYVEQFQEIISEKGYEVLGANNTFFVAEIARQYKLIENNLDEKAKGGLEAILADYQNLVLENQTKKYIINENDDAVFYFIPFNKEIFDIVSFIDNIKDDFKSFAEKNDITIMLNPKSYNNALTGFIGFNFLSEDEGKEITYDFYTTSSVAADFTNPAHVVSAALILKSLCSNKDDFDFLQIHILADGFKFKN